MIKGVIAIWHPYDTSHALLAGGSSGLAAQLDSRARALAAAGFSSDVSSAYYYKVAGTLVLVGKIVGTVDFAIIKAQVSLTVYIYIKGTFEEYGATTITLEAGVQVAVSFQIYCGFFKITLNFLFSARIREQFVLGTDRLQDAPWYCDGKTLARLPITTQVRRRPSRLLAAQAFAGSGPNLAPLAPPINGKLPLTVYFVPQLSIDGTGQTKATQAAVYAVNLFMGDESRTQGTETYTSYTRLLRDTYLWIASSFSGETAKGTPEQELDRTITQAQLVTAREYLAANSDGLALPYADLSALLGNLFQLEVQLPPEVKTADQAAPAATPFPMPPQLAMTATYKGTTVATRDFDTWITADETYLAAVQASINKLSVNLLDELGRKQDEKPKARALLRREAAQQRSLANFVFGDYFTMLAQGLVQDALDAFENYSYLLAPGDSIASICTALNALGSGTENQLTPEVVAWQNRQHPLASATLTISGVPYRIADKNTLGGIATAFGLTASGIAMANAMVEMVLIPGQTIVIGTASHPVPNRATLEETAAAFTLTVAAFADSIAAMAGVLNPLTVLTLNGIAYATGTSNTIVSVADHFGIDVPTLTSSVASLQNLFDRTADPRLTLPGLSVQSNRSLWANIEASSGAAHLSGMAGRYLLNGLRLPTAGLTFSDPAHPCKTAATCGFESLTGQQFPLPSLTDYNPAAPLTITLTNPASLSWVAFPSAASGFAFNVQAEAARQVEDLVLYARGTGLSAPIQAPQAVDLALSRPRQFTFKNNIVLQCAAPVPLPNVLTGATPRPRIWNFSAALLNELSRPVSLAPLYGIEIGSTNANGGRLLPRKAMGYGFATLINVAIKSVTVASADAAQSSKTTYELLGADEVGVNLLQRLLRATTPNDLSFIDGVYIVYPPNQSGNRAEGLQYDSAERYTTFLVKANLSNETNPPASLAKSRLAATPKRGLLNTPYEFLSILWQGSIVRSGGFYLDYVLPDGSGFPDVLFNGDRVANISVVVVYKALEGKTGADGGVLRDFMNAALVDDPVDDANDVVYLVSRSRPASVELTTATTLAAVSATHQLGVGDIARANPGKLLSTAASVTVTSIAHLVGRGQTLAAIVARFGSSEAAIRALNPNVDFNNLAAGTGLHIPDLTASPAVTTPGLTLPEIALYYSTTVDALAWANRDWPGLYDVAGGNLIFDDQLLNEQGTMQPGNVGIVVTRTNPGNGDDSRSYLEQQYNLLGFDQIANTDTLAIAGALPLPAGPATDEDQQLLDAAGPLRSAPRAASDTEPWVYRLLVPAARAARNNPVPASTATELYPAREANPYAGSGGFIQLQLDWRDLMGNRTWSPFEDAAAGNSYPLPTPLSRIGANDDVIGLGQWPSTQYDHLFRRNAADTGAELHIGWSFDPSRYVPQSAGDQGWLPNAEADRQVFALLYYQMVQTVRDGSDLLHVSTVCTLAGDTPVRVTAAKRTAIVAYVLAAWRYVDTVYRTKATPPATNLPQNVDLARSITPAAGQTIVEILVSVRLEREISGVLPEFRDNAASRLAESVIAPRLSKPNQTTGYTLDEYTRSFEAAFQQASSSLRLASGTPRADLGGQGGADTLWAVRLGKTATEPYAVTIKNPAIFFAVAPLSTELQNRPNVTLYTFTPEQGLSATPDQTQTYTGIDLDLWAANALATIDTVLQPQYAVPAFLVDSIGGTSYLAQILLAKRLLADAIVTGMTNILSEPAITTTSKPANFQAARDKLKQQLLIKLANAYAIDAVVQYELQVAAPATTAPAIPPHYYGNPVDPTQVENAADYTASSFKIPLEPTNPLLTFTFAARDASRQSSFKVPFQYRPTHIEHAVEALAAMDGYEASSCLNFIDPPAPLALTTGESSIAVEIPIPLRAYPAAPTLLNQDFVPTPIGTDQTANLKAAKQWAFRFFYAQVHALQNRIDAVVRFNVPQTAQLSAFTVEEPDLFVLLARLNFVLPDLQAVFARDLLGIHVATATTAGDFVRSRNALSALGFLLGNLAAQWKLWTARQAGAADALLTATKEDVPFSVLEDAVTVSSASVDEIMRLRVVIAYTVPLPEGIAAPGILFDGFTAEPTDPDASASRELLQQSIRGRQRGNAHEDVRAGLLATAHRMGDAAPTIERKAWLYKRINPQPGQDLYLGWDEAQLIPQRTAEIAQLDVTQYQNAWSGIQITRNADLVGTANPTRRPFIYTTPEVQFRNKLTPLIDTAATIDVAQVPSGTTEKRTLNGHLTALFSAFFADSPAKTQIVKLEVRYAYRLADTAALPPIEMPVLLYPASDFQIPASWQTGLSATTGPVTRADIYIANVAGEVANWFATDSPSRLGGCLYFDLSAFSSLSNNTQPIVRVRNLSLAIVDVTGLE